MENIDEYIDKNKHYFILMHPLEYLLVPGFGFVWYKSNTTREKWVECEIVEERYKLADNYKVELRAVEEGYGKETFYICDFKSLIRGGCVVPKTEGLECVEVEWIESIYKNYYLHHSAYTLRKVNK